MKIDDLWRGLALCALCIMAIPFYIITALTEKGGAGG